MKRLFLRGNIVAALLILTLIAGTTPAAASSLSTNTRISNNTERIYSQPVIWLKQSRGNTMSGNGRVTVFAAMDSNLVQGDSNNKADIFTYDRVTKVTERISRSSAGGQTDDHSFEPTISADGRYVAYGTRARNTSLGSPCAGQCSMIVVFDRETKKLTLGSLDDNDQAMRVVFPWWQETLPASISADGKHLMFTAKSTAHAASDLYVRDLQAGTTQLASVGNDGSRGEDTTFYQASISGDGRYVAFVSPSQLVAEDVNEEADIYVRDMQQSTTALVTKAFYDGKAHTGSSHTPDISEDGKHIVYSSAATDLVPGDTNASPDIFMYNMQTGRNKRITVATDGGQTNGLSLNPSISRDGSYIVFSSSATNIAHGDNVYSPGTPDLFLHYANHGVTKRILLPQKKDISVFDVGDATISADGKAINYHLWTHTAPDPNAIARNLYINYDPVAHIPFYDPIDILYRLF